MSVTSTSMDTARPRAVVASYSHDSPQHEERVPALVEHALFIGIAKLALVGRGNSLKKLS
jgi:hypothetical protein